MMTAIFGNFLKAACSPGCYIPNKHNLQQCVSPTSCNCVAVHHPELHAYVIMFAPESFKQHPTYATDVASDAAHRRISRRTYMGITCFAETHVRPTHGLMIKAQYQSGFVKIRNFPEWHYCFDLHNRQ